MRSGPMAVAASASISLRSPRAPSSRRHASPNSRLPIQNRPASRPLRARHERFFADRREIAHAPLHAERAVPSRDRLVHEFQAAFVAVFSKRVPTSLPSSSVCSYSVCAELEPQAGEGADIVDARAHFGAALVHVDAHAAFVLRARNAVERGIQARARAEVTARSDPRTPERGAVGADRRAGQRADRRVGVAGFAMHRVGMQREVVRAAVHAHHARAFVVHRARAQFGAALQRLVGQRFRHAAIDDVDRAADRAAAVKQRRRALQHFDLVGEEGFDRHRVVGADRRDVARAQAIAQHLHARAVEAAHDRPADAGPEVGGLHARQLADGFARACRPSPRRASRRRAPPPAASFHRRSWAAPRPGSRRP